MSIFSAVLVDTAVAAVDAAVVVFHVEAHAPQLEVADC